jgi:hypothetical protein
MADGGGVGHAPGVEPISGACAVCAPQDELYTDDVVFALFDPAPINS